MSMVFWDTMLFIYLLEENPTYAGRVAHILARMQDRNDELCTSSFAVGEVLAGAYKIGREDRVTDAVEFFSGPFVTVLPFTLDAALLYGRIQGELGVSKADAIHLACAAEAGVDLFLTNDAALVGKVIPGIQFIASLNTDLF